MHSFQPGDRVSFRTVTGERHGTVEEYHEDDVYTVNPDGGDFPRMVLLGRVLQLLADTPLLVLAD
jgi:hypothetical protein